MDSHSYGGGGYGGGFGGGAAYAEPEPSQQIMVRNVSGAKNGFMLLTNFNTQLPWSTANEDLVELFETTGQVELAEILFDGTRSKGCGVVQFAAIPEAETAIGLYSVLCLSITYSFLMLCCSQVPAIHVRWQTVG